MKLVSLLVTCYGFRFVFYAVEAMMETNEMLGRFPLLGPHSMFIPVVVFCLFFSLWGQTYVAQAFPQLCTFPQEFSDI